MDIETYKAFCSSLAKACTTGVRLYRDKTQLYYYSLYYIEPDPAGPFLQQIIDSGQEAGIITTPLCQFYAFLVLEPGLRLIIGPTCILKDEKKEIDKLLETLRIAQADREGYVKWLRSAPFVNMDRLVWLLVSLATVLYGRVFPAEKVWIERPPEGNRQSVQTEYKEHKMNNMEDMGTSQAMRHSLSWEQMVSLYIESRKTDQLRELFSGSPKVYAGSIFYGGVRQMKNWGIGMIYSMAKAAVRGGISPQQAFLTADSYIRKMEVIQDIPVLEQLMQEVMTDLSGQVEKLRCAAKNGSCLCRLCIRYISQNILLPIRLETMAKELGYSRPYLCSRFKQEMDISLSRYIQCEKIEEAKRFLEFRDYHLSEIASMLGFSSQSHFQTVFKKITGSTPMAYRKQIRLEEKN